MKFWQIELDGVDKTGKDTILHYLEVLGNYTFSINPRGVISQLAYNIIYNRNYDYDLASVDKNKIYIMLTANKQDLQIRCKLTNEPEYDIDTHSKVFNDIYEYLKNEGYICYKYDTSMHTAYNIAKDIITQIKILEGLI